MAERGRPHSGGGGLKGWWARVASNPAFRWRLRVAMPERILITPKDLRSGDAAIATDIYSGVFSFAGKVVTTDGRSPFELQSPSQEWTDTLLGFGWLRHLRSAGLALSRKNARALIADWIAQHGGSHPDSWQPEVTARRIISWLSHSPLFLEDADHVFYRRFVRSLSRQVRFLRAIYPAVEDGYPRLLVATALSYAGLCMSGEHRLLAHSTRRLLIELRRQVLADGGHISRNPGVLVDLLADLIPLKQAFESRNLTPPSILSNSIASIMPMLRFFRHGDGTLAQFNGMGATPTDLLSAVLASDDVHAQPDPDAQASGFQRLAANGTAMIADTGKPPPAPLSKHAHAGCLSFEFSTKRQRIVVNCGVPTQNQEAWREVARSSAAHSTVTWHDTSSCRFRRFKSGEMRVVSGPRDVEVTRGEIDDAVVVRASHDGYAGTFDIVHQRSWRLSPGGDRLDGEDIFTPRKGGELPPATNDDYVIRFHLHPSVKASRVNDGRTVLLILPGRESWLFTAPNMRVEVEESIFLTASEGPRRTSQIVIADNARTFARVLWTFMRADMPERLQAEEEAPELPLAEG